MVAYLSRNPFSPVREFHEDGGTFSALPYTYLFGLSDDYIGYVLDREAFDLGGYQTWTGLHSFVAPGIGEAIVEEVVRMVSDLNGPVEKSGCRSGFPALSSLTFDDEGQAGMEDSPKEL